MQTKLTINSRKHGKVMYLRSVDEIGTTRLLRSGDKILRCQKTLSRARYAEFRAKGGFFSAGAFAVINWIA